MILLTLARRRRHLGKHEMDCWAFPRRMRAALPAFALMLIVLPAAAFRTHCPTLSAGYGGGLRSRGATSVRHFSRPALAANVVGSATARVQTYFGEYVVRSLGDADAACVKSLAADSMDRVEACRATGGEVLVVVRNEGELVAAVGARILKDTAHVETAFWSVADDVRDDVRCELLTFLVRCLEAACKHRRNLSVIIARRAPENHPHLKAPEYHPPTYINRNNTHSIYW